MPRSLLSALALGALACVGSVVSAARPAEREAPVLMATNPLKIPYNQPGQNAGDTPDPDIVRVETPDGSPLYVLTHTVMINGGDIPIYASKDLINWEFRSYAFNATAKSGASIQVGSHFYCELWAPEIRPSMGEKGGYVFSFTASRFATFQDPCPGYDEGSGTYISWAPSPFGPFPDPQPTGTAMDGSCPTELHQQVPFAWDVDHANCAPGLCNNTMRLDSNLFNDPLTGESWFAYAWYTNSHAQNDWDAAQLGEHTSIVKVNASDPVHVLCSAEDATKVWALSPHDNKTLAQLNSSCARCSEQLSFFQSRLGTDMTRDGLLWGVVEAPMMFRRGDYVYLLSSHSAWDSAYYSVLWIAAKTVEDLDLEHGDRLVGRFLIPSKEQAFGHGSVVLGPDNEHYYYVHHHLNHAECHTPQDVCMRDIYISPLEFEDRNDGRGQVWIKEVFPAENLQVPVYQSDGPQPGQTIALA